MSIDFKALKQERELLNAKKGFADNFVQMPEGNGSLILRILPPREGQALPFAPTRIHRIEVEGKTYNVHCPKRPGAKGYEGQCPVCDFYNGLWSESKSVGNEREAERLQNFARSIKPVQRWYYNVLVRKMKDSEGNLITNVGPKILAVGITVHKKIMNALMGDSLKDLEALGDVTDTLTGRDFILVKSVKGGPGNFPEYNDSTFSKPSRLGTDAEITEWLSKLHNLEALITFTPREEVLTLVKKLEAKLKGEDKKDTTVAPPKVIHTSTTVDVDSDEAMSDETFLKSLQTMDT